MKSRNKWMKTITVSIILLSLIAGCGENGDKGGNMPEFGKNMKSDSMGAKSRGADMNEMHEKNMQGDFEHIMIKLPTMQCQMCKEKIETAVNELDGIKSVDVDKEEKVVHINFAREKTGPEKIERAITSAGYDANDKKADPEAYSKLDDCCKLPEDRKKK